MGSMGNEQIGNNAPEQKTETNQETFNRQLGASVLANVGFEQRRKDIVESSFSKSRSRGEKLPGKNNERRNLAYINRLSRMTEQYGDRLERRLWKASAKKLIIEPADIQESYWASQEQILRDNGRADTYLDDYDRELLTEKIQEQQLESLEPWVNYLGDKDSPYPLWFKLYVWDGMSKMGVFNKEKQRFDARNKHTVAPYPRLNQAVLAKTYRSVLDAYGVQDSAKEDIDGLMLVDAPGEKILNKPSSSINFNEIYSRILLNEKSVLQTPERTEDVHGKWIEYLPGDEIALANAAEGTPWCVADPGTGKNYLTYGTYDNEDVNPTYGVYDEDEEAENQNRAKFILFHLQDEETGVMSENACASIRLDPYGKVAEISGLGDGQALENSLVPIVEEKVKTLPGGEHYLKGFADKKMLIALDRKTANGEELTNDELEFLYEINRFIVTLDTYNDVDPRIGELQGRHSDMAKERGILTEEHKRFLFEAHWSQHSKIQEHFAEYLASGENVNMLLETTKNRRLTSENARLALAADGVDAELLFTKMGQEDISEHATALLQRGISPELIVPKLDEKSTAKNFGALMKAGVEIDTIIPRLSTATVAKNARSLIDRYHASQAAIVNRLPNETVEKNFNYLLKNQGIDINLLIPKLHSSIIKRNMKYLADNGASGDTIAASLSTLELIDSFDELVGMGIKFDLDELSKRLSPTDALWRLDALDRLGIKYDINEMIRGADVEDVDRLADDLIERGADRDVIVEILGDKYF